MTPEVSAETNVTERVSTKPSPIAGGHTAIQSLLFEGICWDGRFFRVRLDTVSGG